ncbi:hypothetical protein [Streptomyces sp. enrichment culture]|uniref:hypothetical protein n=1 Tax=Streptomyces sp. enrichment culture TaxID=1795815 RepID=UPI003F55CB9B
MQQAAVRVREGRGLDGVLLVLAEEADHLGECAEPEAGRDGAALLDRQRPYFTDLHA